MVFILSLFPLLVCNPLFPLSTFLGDAHFYVEYITRNAGLEETQAGIKIAGRNINNFGYADDTTLMAESEEELKSLLMKVKEESEKVGLTCRSRGQQIRNVLFIDHPLPRTATGKIKRWEIQRELEKI